MASAVLDDPTRALQGPNRERGPIMEDSENDVGSLKQLLLYAEEHYLAGKLPLRSCRCSGAKRSARKGRFDLIFASSRCLVNVCGTIAKLTSARIFERVTAGSTSACRTIL
ncbi:hypothetical protein TNCV_2898611 [Trichonephila clavipes]|nr:hypothetical protein TNCV_2898611 [Trichonephila clavipes]